MFGLSYLDLGIILAYVLFIIYLGWHTKKKVASSGDYFMGGRRGSKLMMIANALGAGTHTDQAVAVSGATYEIGLAGIWYQWVWLLSTPFYWLVAPIYRRVRYVTTGDFFEERYGAKVGAAYTIMGLLFFTISLGLILRGTGAAMEAATQRNLSTKLIVILLTVFFLGYSVLGGLVSALFVNLIQGMFILVLSFLLIPFAINVGNGMSEIKASLPEHMFSFIAPQEVTLFFIVMVIINGLVGIVVQPHHMAVGGAGKTEKSCRTGWTYGNFAKRFATLGWAFVGVLAAALFPGLEDREWAFGTAAARLLPSGMLGLMLAAMAAAVLAACHNYMVAFSALFTRNIYRRFFATELAAGKELKVARITSVIMVIGSVTVALTIPSVVEGLKILWQITAYFGIAFWMGVIWRRANRYAVWASLAVAIFATLLTGAYFSFRLGPFWFGWGWDLEYQIAVYLPLGFLVFIVVARFTPSEPKAQLDKFYTLLHTPVGEEHKLKEKNIDIMLEGESEIADETKTDVPLEERGHSLLVVDLLSLPKTFSFARYRVDLVGFAWAILFVLAVFATGLICARIG